MRMRECNLFQIAWFKCIPFKHSNQLFKMDKREIAALEEWTDPSIFYFLQSDTEQEPNEKEAVKPTEFKVTSNRDLQHLKEKNKTK